VSDEQLDLFAGSYVSEPRRGEPPPGRPQDIVPAELNDAALLAAIPSSGLASGPSLAAEAGRRRLVAAIPVLEDYCRRFAGFGTRHTLAEQVAALGALTAIGGAEASRSVARIVSRGWVQGPTLAAAVAAAVQLRSQLPGQLVATLMRHADPAVRADACRLARTTAGTVETLIDLLADLHRKVTIEAACALARLGRAEGLALLKWELRQAPSRRLIDAVAVIADDECLVEFGRTARASPELADAAYDALEASEHDLAARILAGLRR
jgi:hypothetical protein